MLQKAKIWLEEIRIPFFTASVVPIFIALCALLGFLAYYQVFIRIRKSCVPGSILGGGTIRAPEFSKLRGFFYCNKKN